jgi:hypothetical protein
MAPLTLLPSFNAGASGKPKEQAMTTLALKSATRFAAILAAALAATTANSDQAAAASACPGGGTQKCTFKCTGPVTAPKCEYVEPCTCTLGGNKVSGVRPVATRGRGPLINVPPRPIPGKVQLQSTRLR